MSDPSVVSGDIDMTGWLLNGKKMPAYWRESIIGGSLNQTIEGASSLVLNVNDDTGKIIKSKYFFGGDRYRSGYKVGLPAKKPLKLRALALDWQLAQVDKSDDNTLTLTFEDLRIALLRTHKKPKKVSRNKKTRAEFFKSMVAEVKRPRILFVCPQLNKKQAIAGSKSTAKDDIRGKGFASGANLKIKGVKANTEQLRNLDKALSAADAEGAGTKIMTSMVMAAIQENNCKNTGTDGMFQVLPSTARALGISSKDISEVAAVWVSGKNGKGFRGANTYASAIVQSKPDISLNDLAQAVEGSAHPKAYGQWASEAKAIVSAFGGGKRSAGKSEYKKYEFSRGLPGGKKNENTWDCMKRLADEVGWRVFMVRQYLYFISEEDLIRSRPRATFNTNSKGVVSLNWSIDANRSIDECTLTCRKEMWNAPPGSVVLIEDEGPADGRWIVTSISRSDLFSVNNTIELRRGRALQPEKLEPAPEAEDKDANAAQQGGAEATGEVKIAAGANRSGAPIAKSTMGFLAEVAGEYGGTIVVTTGTNHSKFTTTGNVSDHYDGHAADIAVPASSKKGDQICAAALRAAGIAESVAASRARSGGAWTIQDGGMRIQVLWKTNVGGNHYNHVHIGAR